MCSDAKMFPARTLADFSQARTNLADFDEALARLNRRLPFGDIKFNHCCVESTKIFLQPLIATRKINNRFGYIISDLNNLNGLIIGYVFDDVPNTINSLKILRISFLLPMSVIISEQPYPYCPRHMAKFSWETLTASS